MLGRVEVDRRVRTPRSRICITGDEVKETKELWKTGDSESDLKSEAAEGGFEDDWGRAGLRVCVGVALRRLVIRMRRILGPLDGKSE